MAHISQDLERTQKVKKGMFTADKGIAYLRALIELIPRSHIENWKDTRTALRKVLVTLQHSAFFKDEQYDDFLRKQKSTMEETWKLLEGPDRRYRKEAARYLRPLVRDLSDYLFKNLRELLRENPTPYIDKDPPPA